MCQTILGISVSVNDAGSIFWCARARRLGYSAAQRAQRAVSSLAQWQRPRIATPDVDLRRSAAPHHKTELGGAMPRRGRCESQHCPHTSARPRLKVFQKKSKPRPGVWWGWGCPTPRVFCLHRCTAAPLRRCAAAPLRRCAAAPPSCSLSIRCELRYLNAQLLRHTSTERPASSARVIRASRTSSPPSTISHVKSQSGKSNRKTKNGMYEEHVDGTRS